MCGNGPRCAPPHMPTLLNEPPLRPTHEVFRVERILDPDEPRARRDHRVIAVLPAYNRALREHDFAYRGLLLGREVEPSTVTDAADAA